MSNDPLLLSPLLIHPKLCPSCAGKLTDFPCSISLTRTTCLLSPLLTLLNHLLHHFFFTTNSLRATQQLRPRFHRVCYLHHCQPTSTFSHSNSLMNDRPCLYRHHLRQQFHSITAHSSTKQKMHPPVTWIPHTLHNNAPLPITTSSTTLTIIHVPTPIPPTSTSVTCYMSPLVIRFNPCASCGSADSHLPGCSTWSQSLQD